MVNWPTSVPRNSSPHDQQQHRSDGRSVRAVCLIRGTELTKTTSALNTNAGNPQNLASGPSSVFGTATASAGIFDSTTISANPANWYLAGGATGVSGLGTAWNLYGVTGTANPSGGRSRRAESFGYRHVDGQWRHLRRRELDPGAAPGRDLAVGQWLAGSRRRGPPQGRRPDCGLNQVLYLGVFK